MQVWKSNFFSLWNLLGFVKLFSLCFYHFIIINRETSPSSKIWKFLLLILFSWHFFQVVAIFFLTFFPFLKPFEISFTGNSWILLQSMIFKHSHQHPLCCKYSFPSFKYLIYNVFDFSADCYTFCICAEQLQR